TGNATVPGDGRAVRTHGRTPRQQHAAPSATMLHRPHHQVTPRLGCVFDLAGEFREGYDPTARRRANREGCVWAFGAPASQPLKRRQLIAVAVSVWSSCVLANPRYLVRRRPQLRTPCETVPSIPERLAYRSVNSRVFSRSRAARSAS